MGGYKEKPKRNRPKRKSIKAPIHSRMDPKRKISRMGKKRQKHKAGLDAVFVSNLNDQTSNFMLTNTIDKSISLPKKTPNNSKRLPQTMHPKRNLPPPTPRKQNTP